MGEAIARLAELRDCFNRAKKRLEALPETGLSEDGQPCIREVAEALQSFAAWFSELTLEDMSLTGSARRVQVAWNGLDAIADWIGLHRSQQFAADLREHMGELIERSEALDDAVSAAFTVKRTAGSTELSRSRRVSQPKRDAIENGIEAVASLAGYLGIRLQRIAVMAAPSVKPKKSAIKQSKKRSRKGVGGRPATFEVSFIREVVAARERDAKQAAKAKKPQPPLATWLRDYCDGQKINIREKFPPAFEGEPWQARASRFWKAAKTRLSRAGN